MRFLILSAALLAGGIFAMPFFNKKPEKVKISAELEKEVANYPLEVIGEVPVWLSGTLVRNGPIQITINGKTNKHWIDGLAMLHAFSFDQGRVNYTNRYLRSNAYQTVFKEGSLDYHGFASDPCRSLFKNFLTLLLPSSHPVIQNANVNVAKLEDTYVALTEVPLPVRFDLQTLETLGVFNYQDELPKDKCWESAHPHENLEKQETLNYLIKYGQKSYYTLYSLQKGSGQRKIVTEVPVDEPSYMHSFAITENFVIFTEFPLVVKPLDLLTKGKPFIDNFSWKSKRGTRFIVIDRHKGNIIGEYITRPFFAFHHANAFERDGNIYLDIVTYETPEIVIRGNLEADSEDRSHIDDPSKLERFSLSLKTGEITSKILLDQSNEFPRINDLFDGIPYRYVYVAGIAPEFPSKHTFEEEGLYKVNTETKEFLKWSEKGCSPGEPVFVLAPNAKEEDDGVILALILDHLNHSSFLLVLDAKTFKELGRTRAPHLIPAGFHGQYFQK